MPNNNNNNFGEISLEDLVQQVEESLPGPEVPTTATNPPSAPVPNWATQTIEEGGTTPQNEELQTTNPAYQVAMDAYEKARKNLKEPRYRLKGGELTPTQRIDKYLNAVGKELSASITDSINAQFYPHVPEDIRNYMKEVIRDSVRGKINYYINNIRRRLSKEIEGVNFETHIVIGNKELIELEDEGVLKVNKIQIVQGQDWPKGIDELLK